MAEVSTSDIIPICIPKTEPCETRCNSSDDLSLSSLEPLIPFTAPNKLKDPVIILERCDKIWKTLTLIKKLQIADSSVVNNNDKKKSKPAEDPKEPESLSVNEKQEQPYVTYQPMLVNDTASLPNLKISVKNRKRLYHCTTCGKQYVEARWLRHHSAKIHGIIIPLKRVYRRCKPRTVTEKLEKTVKDTVKLDEEQTAVNVKQPGGKVVTEKEQLKKSSVEVQSQKARNFSQNNTVHKEVHSQKEKDITVLQKEMPVQKSLPIEDAKVTSALQQAYICMLCQQKVKSLRNHLIEYHKIECPDIMIKQFANTLSTNVNNRIIRSELQKTPAVESARERIDQNVNQSHVARPMKRIEKDTDENKKRKFPTVVLQPRKKAKHIPASQNQSDPSDRSNTPGKGKYQCDICCGVYSNNINLGKHKLKHIKNGETKEKLHLFAFRYRRSPYYTKPKDLVTSSLATTSVFPSTDDVVRSSNKNISNVSLEGQNESSAEKQLSANGNEYGPNICKCGKSFRQPHTLHLHKKKCNIYSGELQEDVRSSSDRDSGIAINITIKKKNNSYEIVGKEDGSEVRSKDSDHTQDDISSDVSDCTPESLNNTLIKDKNFNTLESSKYSKEHSVLKLEFVEEDVDVDIEEEDAKQSIPDTALNTVTNTTEDVSSTSQTDCNTEQVNSIDPLVCKTEMGNECNE